MRKKILLAVSLAAAITLQGCFVKRLEEPVLIESSTGPTAFPCCVLNSHGGY